jgi:putative DNA primase/helicase
MHYDTTNDAPGTTGSPGGGSDPNKPDSSAGTAGTTSRDSGCQKSRKMPFNPDKIPDYLKSRKQWLLWRYETPPKAKKPTKVPYQINGKKASTTDPATWNDFYACVKALRSGGYDGIGFVFAKGDGLTGADLDHCLDATGQPEPWAKEILEQFRVTYVEITPSGEGFHIICFGKPVGKRRQKKWKKPDADIDEGVEIYDHTSPRYFTVTGNAVNTAGITDCQAGLDWLYQEHLAEKHEEPPQARQDGGRVDEELVLKALEHIPAEDYKTWLDVGMALKDVGLGLEVWETWSQRSPEKYSPGMCAEKWESFNRKGIGLGTIFHLAKNNGFKFYSSKPFIDPATSLEVEVPFGYRLSASGVWKIKRAANENGEDTRERIAGPAWVSALTRQPRGSAWGFIVNWIDRDEIQRKRAIMVTRFHEDGKTLAQELAFEGLEIVPGRETELSKYLGQFKPYARLVSMERSGWLDSPDGSLTFVTPAATIQKKGSKQEVVFQPERHSPTALTMTASGTLESWQENVAARCKWQPFLIFMLCAAFAGALLKHARQDSGGFHLYTRSSQGKTTAAQIAASVWGCGADPADAPDLAFIRKWHSTANALEGLAAAHTDGILILDELNTCQTKDFGNVVYNLLGGQGKNAMDTSRNLKKQRAWRILLLSTGEVTSQQKIEEDLKRSAKAGQMVRLIDIPADGIIQNVGDTREFVNQLKLACSKHYGTAGPEFTHRIIDGLAGARELQEIVLALKAEAATRLTPKGAENEVARATERFALVEVAGLLAVAASVLPFNEQEVQDAVKTVHSAWLQEAVAIPDVVRGVEAVRQFILRHQDSRFKPVNSKTDSDDKVIILRDLAGYHDTDNRLYLFTADAFREACRGANHNQVATELLKRGLLFVNESDRRQSKHLIPDKGPLRFFAVKEDILVWEP